MDDVDLQSLSDNYFSRSKPQAITAVFNVENAANFHSDLLAPKLTISGRINGININEFVQTTILQDLDQIFEVPLYLESCQING